MQCLTVSIPRRLIYPFLCCTSTHISEWPLYTVFLYDRCIIVCCIWEGWSGGLILSMGKRFLSSPKVYPVSGPYPHSYSPAIKRKVREVVHPLFPSSVKVKEWPELYLCCSYMPWRRAQAQLHPILASYFTVCCSVKHISCNVNFQLSVSLLIYALLSRRDIYQVSHQFLLFYNEQNQTTT